jgi:dTDP-glucose pyrophosphorylase
VKQNIAAFIVEIGTTTLQAMRQLEETAQKILFVVGPEWRLIGSLTDGDIRRWILAEGNLQDPIGAVCNKIPYHVGQDYDLEQVRAVMIQRNIGCVPVVDDHDEIVELLFWESVFKDKGKHKPITPIHLPVVIMAGGKGTRLDPFTRILPKPLIPLGDKTVVEHIIESFLKFGVSTFYLSVNHKSRIIKSYFEELHPPYAIEYIHEDSPLGTAGSLRYLRDKLTGSFIVTNCDILIDADFAELVEFHHKNNNDITIVGSLKNYHIPYGICEIVNGGTLVQITEKPEYNFLVNTGMYVLRAETLRLIAEGEIFHMTHLIEKVKETGGKVAVFPVSDKAWLDTGEWAEYRKALKQLQVE